MNASVKTNSTPGKRKCLMKQETKCICSFLDAKSWRVFAISSPNEPNYPTNSITNKTGTLFLVPITIRAYHITSLFLHKAVQGDKTNYGRYLVDSFLRFTITHHGSRIAAYCLKENNFTKPLLQLNKSVCTWRYLSSLLPGSISAKVEWWREEGWKK